MKKYKIGMIGTGGRSVCFGTAYAEAPEIEVVAVADPNRDNRREFLRMTGLAERNPRAYDDWRQLYDGHPDLDGVAIVTPTNLHREQAVPFLERGIPVALEKPLSTTMADSEAILAAAAKHRGRILLGFVLRSTPFYRKIHELLSGSAIGRVLTVQADELVSLGVTSILTRGAWRRRSEYSGGVMMEKSSHDMDLLNWLVGSRPVAVNSFGGSLLFRPNPLLPETCEDCVHPECPYRQAPRFDPAAGDAVLRKFMQEGFNNLCVYNSDKDICDNQSVSIRFANGAVANFMLSLNCDGPRSGRNFHAVGTLGRLWGNISDQELFLHRNREGRTEKVELPPPDSGHGGGDRRHALELLAMMRDPSYRPAQDAYAGYLSNAVCIAADLSLAEARQIHLRYDTGGFVAFT